MEWTIAAAVAGAVAVVVLAIGVQRANRRANELIPGVATSAPAAWAGAHTPEARLHRRLRDAARAVHAAGEADSGAGATLVAHCRAVDEHLVAVAALPPSVRDAPLDQVQSAVEAIEHASAAVVTDRSAQLPLAIEDVRQRLDLLAQARAELESG